METATNLVFDSLTHSKNPNTMSAIKIAALLLLVAASANAACIETGYRDGWSDGGTIDISYYGDVDVGGGISQPDPAPAPAPAPAPPPPAPKVELFEHWKYEGERQERDLTDKCQNLGTLEDKLTAIKSHGACIQVFKDKECKGPSKKYTGDFETINRDKFDGFDGEVGDHVKSFKKC